MATPQALSSTVGDYAPAKGSSANDVPQQFCLFRNFSEQDWLPDELLYSWVSRYHRLSCSARHRTTAKRLFGRERLGYETDLPAQIDTFVQAVAGHLGSAASILLHHTILPYYLLFRARGDAEDAVASIRAGHLRDAKTWLGMPRNGANHLSLKACAACCEVDRRIHGTAYWHVTHQLPGVILCPIHVLPLASSSAAKPNDRRYRWKYQWALPASESAETFAAADPSINRECKKILIALARVSSDAFESVSEFQFDSLRLASTYRYALKARGLNDSYRDVAPALLSAMSPVSAFSQTTGISSKEESAAAQITQILAKQCQGNSLQNLTLITWLFGSWEKFLRTYRSH